MRRLNEPHSFLFFHRFFSLFGKKGCIARFGTECSESLHTASRTITKKHALCPNLLLLRVVYSPFLSPHLLCDLCDRGFHASSLCLSLELLEGSRPPYTLRHRHRHRRSTVHHHRRIGYLAANSCAHCRHTTSDHLCYERPWCNCTYAVILSSQGKARCPARGPGLERRKWSRSGGAYNILFIHSN